MLVYLQMDPVNSPGFLFGRSIPRKSLAFKIKMKPKKPLGGRNSNTGHGGSENLQEVPPSASLTS